MTKTHLRTAVFEAPLVLLNRATVRRRERSVHEVRIYSVSELASTIISARQETHLLSSRYAARVEGCQVSVTVIHSASRTAPKHME